MTSLLPTDKIENYIRVRKRSETDMQESFLGKRFGNKMIRQKDIFKNTNKPQFMQSMSKKDKTKQNFLRYNLLEKKHFLSNIIGNFN